MCWPMGRPKTEVGVGSANVNLATLWLIWFFLTSLNSLKFSGSKQTTNTQKSHIPINSIKDYDFFYNVQNLKLRRKAKWIKSNPPLGFFLVNKKNTIVATTTTTATPMATICISDDSKKSISFFSLVGECLWEMM